MNLEQRQVLGEKMSEYLNIAFNNMHAVCLDGGAVAVSTSKDPIKVMEAVRDNIGRCQLAMGGSFEEDGMVCSSFMLIPLH